MMLFTDQHAAKPEALWHSYRAPWPSQTPDIGRAHSHVSRSTHQQLPPVALVLRLYGVALACPNVYETPQLPADLQRACDSLHM